jgi:hypothetical protein
MPQPYDYRIERPDVMGAIGAYQAGRDQKNQDEAQERQKMFGQYLPGAIKGDPGATAGAQSTGTPDQLLKLQQLSAEEKARMNEEVGLAAVSLDTPEKWAAGAPDIMQKLGLPGPVPDFSQRERIITQSKQAREYLLAKGNARTYEQDLALKQAGATNVTVNNAGEREFEKKVGGAQADMFAEIAKDGIAAKSDLASIGELSANLAKTPGGVVGGLQQFALSWGVQLGQGATEAQAANAIISKLVPSQRPPGSGPMSDRDVLMFKDSLPKLVNTREGNALIVSTMKAMAEYRIQQANIASAAMAGELGRAEATQLLNNLPNPLEAFKKSRSSGGKPGPGQIERSKDKRGRPIVKNPDTGIWEYE